MENKNEVKEKVKKAFEKMFRVQTIIFIITISIALTYYTSKFCINKQLVFGVNDSKLLLCLVVMFVWVMVFCVYLMIQLSKKDDIIIQQNITIEGLLHQVIQQGNNIENKATNIEEKANEIIEQNDYIVEQADENYDQLVKFHKSNRQIFMERNDNIA